jgi:nicotinate-nucleotide adenylyltransferase
VTTTTATAPRIGLFGGSFDPPHNGHLALARQAFRELALDELRWIPAGRPWQKADRRLASAEHRSEMVKLTIVGERGHRLDRRELDRAGPSYTIDTVAEVAAEAPAAELSLVIGADLLAGLSGWHRWRELVSRVTIAVAAREAQAPTLPTDLAAESPRIVPLTLPRVDCSSTLIRQRVADGLDLNGLVGEPVARYIARHALYAAQQRD